MDVTAGFDVQEIARRLRVPVDGVRSTVELLEDENTVPFITRFRKDRTGGLNEEQITQIQAALEQAHSLSQRKETILKAIETQDKMTAGLAEAIRKCRSPKLLEDLYLPFKRKKQSRAAIARQRGLEPLSLRLFDGEVPADRLEQEAAALVDSEQSLPSTAKVLAGVRDLLAERISEMTPVRRHLREVIRRHATLVATRLDPEGEEPPIAESEASAVAAESETDIANGPSPAIVDEAPGRGALEGPQGDVCEAVLGDESSGAGSAELTEADTPEPEGTGSDAPEADAPDADTIEAAESPEPLQDTLDVPCGVEADAVSRDGAVPAEDVVLDSSGVEATSGPAEDSPTAEGGPDVGSHHQGVPTEPTEKEGPPDSEPKVGILKAAPAVQLARSLEIAKQKEANQRRQQRREMRKRKRMKLEASFADYFGYREKLSKIPPHRILAINRGERTRVLRVKLEIDGDQIFQEACPLVVSADHPHPQLLEEGLRDALTRLLIPSLERGIRREMSEKAEQHALEVFARNLRKLFIQPPVRKRVLAIDPGFRTGCKLVALDEFGKTLDHTLIHIIGDESKLADGRKRLTELLRKHELHVVAIGNGTACREAESTVAQVIAEDFPDGGLAYVIVNEAGASVYSTSALAREELPQYDATLRGAISIGRRLQDPLSELVKIHPSNIGVGMYQHDVKSKPLRDSLNAVVESCVNYVGVNLNAASPALLGYVSGLNQLTARRIYEHRQEHGPFRTREQLKDVPGIGDATFVQAAGFLKIVDGDNPLDATWIHPESYDVAQTVLDQLNSTLDDLAADLVAPEDGSHVGQLAQKVCDLDVDQVAEQLSVGRLLLQDILETMQRPGRDPREDLPPPIFRSGVVKLEDLEPGMELSATVLNVVDFGAFVDIGLPDSGLVHISRLADRYIRDPHDVVSVGDVLRVWVVEIDKQRRRVSLTAIKPGSEKPRTSRQDNRPTGGRSQAKKPRPQRAAKKAEGGKKPRHERPRRPRKPPTPVVPITPEMREGKQPMRTFSDLLQFYGDKKSDRGDDTPEAGEKSSQQD